MSSQNLSPVEYMESFSVFSIDAFQAPWKVPDSQLVLNKYLRNEKQEMLVSWK